MLRMTAFILVLSFFLLSSPSGRANEANGCPNYQPPVINVKKLVVAPRYNDTFDLASLKQLTNEGGLTITSTRHETPVGLTAASLKIDTQYDIRISSSPDDPLICAQIAAMNLNFGFDDTTVYIAKEIPHDSCSYTTVLDHELKHVRTDDTLINVTIPVLPGYLRKALDQIGVIRASSPETAERQLKTMINEYMRTLGANLSEVRKNQQALIDTEAEYDRISSSCDGALGELTAHVRPATSIRY